MVIWIYTELNSKDAEEVLLNKKDFISEVAKRCMITPYVVEEIYNVSSGLVAETLIKGEQIEIPKMGKFVLKEKKETTYKNLYGGESKTVGKTVYPLFQVASWLKTRVKNGHKYDKIG